MRHAIFRKHLFLPYFFISLFYGFRLVPHIEKRHVECMQGALQAILNPN